MNMWEFVKRIGQGVVIIAILFSGWTASYFIWRRLPVSPYLEQIIISFSGFLLFGLFMFCLTRFTNIAERQNRFFKPMVEAIDAMAQGNFNIDLSFYHKQPSRPHPFFKNIIDSIDHMALELGEMEQMRQEFISNVSHEIQSPLTSINGFAIALKNGRLSPEKRQHYLEIIETESMRLSKLSENLLKLTSLESDHPPFEPASFRVDQQIRRVILALEPHWTEKHLVLDIDLDPLPIVADEDLLEQVWMNIIHNSIKFTPADGQICIRTKVDDNHVHVSIKDTGIGMSEEVKRHIFERFYKEDKARNRSAGGNGLGLSIVKKIVELHEGSVHVESVKSTGTEFEIILPV